VNVKNRGNSISGGSNYREENNLHDVEGFVIWYLNHKPVVKDMYSIFGYKANFNGVGVHVFKHDGEWRIQAIVN
jgi:hypothetical protein